MFLSFFPFISAFFELYFCSESVLPKLNLVLPCTSFFFIYNPKDIKNSLPFYVPTTFLLSMAPKNAIGFSWLLISNVDFLHLKQFFSLPTSKTLSLDVLILINSINFQQYISMSFMYSKSSKASSPCFIFL